MISSNKMIISIRLGKRPIYTKKNLPVLLVWQLAVSSILSPEDTKRKHNYSKTLFKIINKLIANKTTKQFTKE